jgi:sulfonate transport system permease protein
MQMRIIINKAMAFVQLVALPTFLLALWSALAAAGLTNSYLLPHPADIGNAAIELLSSGILQEHAWSSACRSIGGFLLTALLALPLAVLLASAPRLYRATSLVLGFLRVVPPLALIPLLILWLGIGEAAKLSIVVLSSFFPIFLNTYSGLAKVDSRLIELGLSLQLTKREGFVHILLPHALPSILTGLRLGFGYSWRALAGAELIAASTGLGFLIGEAAEMARTDRLFVGIISIAILGIGGDYLFQSLVRCCAPWSAERDRQVNCV